MIPHVNVIIATPGHSMMTSYIKSLLILTDTLNKQGITWTWMSEYSSHVGDARELTIAGTHMNDLKEQRPLEGRVTYDVILWIDSDIAFNPEDAMKLIKSDKQIISGAYLLGSGEVVAYPVMTKNPFTFEQVKDMTEPIKIEGCGFGFLAVKAGVFESLTRPWFQSTPVTTEDGITFNMMGEDLSWCKRVTNAGYEIWLDPTVRVIHHKMMKLTWEGPRP